MDFSSPEGEFTLTLSNLASDKERSRQSQRLSGYAVSLRSVKSQSLEKRGLVKSDNSVYPRAERVVSAHILSRLHFMKCGSFEWADFGLNAALICLAWSASVQPRCSC